MIEKKNILLQISTLDVTWPYKWRSCDVRQWQNPSKYGNNQRTNSIKVSDESIGDGDKPFADLEKDSSKTHEGKKNLVANKNFFFLPPR